MDAFTWDKWILLAAFLLDIFFKMIWKYFIDHMLPEEQLWDELWRRILDRSVKSPLRRALIPKNVVQRYVLSIRPLYAVIAAGKGHGRYWTNLNQVN